MSIYLIVALVFVIAITMAMVGKGGGNFYVLALVLSGITMHQAASTSQSMMFGTSIAAMLIFHKNKIVDWKLAFVVASPVFIMAFFGGYFAGSVDGTTLKIVFAVLLILVSLFMFLKIKEKHVKEIQKFGYWNRTFNGYTYAVNLWLTIPMTAIIGLFAGATGISGGAFLIPLMVMLCGIPMKIAIGTSSAMVTATALMGLLGYTLNGNFDFSFALPLIGVAIIGGILGGKLALKSKPKNLKNIFAFTNLFAGVLMLINILL